VAVVAPLISLACEGYWVFHFDFIFFCWRVGYFTRQRGISRWVDDRDWECLGICLELMLGGFGGICGKMGEWMGSGRWREDSSLVKEPWADKTRNRDGN